MTRLASVLGALAAPRVVPVRVVPRVRRVDVAVMMTDALGGAREATEIQRLACEVAWRGCSAHEGNDEAVRLARILRDRCVDYAEPQVMFFAVIRELLTDSARDGAMELDRCVRDAALTHGYIITATHEAEAARMITEVMG